MPRNNEMPMTKSRQARKGGKPAANPLRHLRASDLRGVAGLVTDSITGVNRITEGVHQSVLGALGFPGGQAPGQATGITGLVYRSIDGVTRHVARTIESALAALQPLFERIEQERPGTPEREVVISILNGVMGDRLVATNNPLAIRMSLRYRGQALDARSMPAAPRVTGKVLVLVHGLCMSDVQWHAGGRERGGDRAQGVDHGEALAVALGYTPIYLRYNSGLHVSQNGRELAGRLEQLVAIWPVPIDELTLVGYSMGGLVTRSACHYGSEGVLRWIGLTQNIVFLATPHHGAPLERAGNRLDAVLGSTPFSAPFGRLIKLRSAGITDLRYGHLVDEDWLGRDRFHRAPDRRHHVPLPEGVRCFALAATLASRRSPVAERLVGDGLVPLSSALGRHDDARRTLGFARAAQAVACNVGHLEVLSRREVTRQLVEWLTPA